MPEPDFKHRSSSDWQDEMPVTNRYTFGAAGERFFRAIKDEGRILGSCCKDCDRIYVPAVIFCERCLHETSEWIDVGTVGEIVTFTELHIAYDGSPLEPPELVALVRFGDGGIIHRLVVDDTQQVEIGQHAKVVFKPSPERQGSILDISHFELVST